MPDAIVFAAGGVDVAAGGVTAEAGGVALGPGGGIVRVPDVIVAAAGGVVVAAGGVAAEASGAALVPGAIFIAALGIATVAAMTPSFFSPFASASPAEEEGGAPPDGQAVALQSGRARAAGSASKGPFALKRGKTDEALVLGFSKAQPVKQA